MTVYPGLGGQAALVRVGCPGMLEPGLTRVLILLRYLVSAAVVCLNISDQCLLTDGAVVDEELFSLPALIVKGTRPHAGQEQVCWWEKGWGFSSSILEEQLSPACCITSSPALSFPDEIGRWKCWCKFCVLVGLVVNRSGVGLRCQHEWRLHFSTVIKVLLTLCLLLVDCCTSYHSPWKFQGRS